MSCVHRFLPDDTHQDYDRCENCGTYHRKDYAGRTERDHPEFWRAVMLRHIPIPEEEEKALVIGVGQSVLPVMETVYTGGYGVVLSLADEAHFPASMPESLILHGIFPESTNGIGDGAAKAMAVSDTLEYTPDYVKFFDEISRLLAPGGTAIISCPVLLADKPKPAEFDTDWVFTEKFLNQYLSERFSSVRIDQPEVGHELIIVKK